MKKCLLLLLTVVLISFCGLSFAEAGQEAASLLYEPIEVRMASKVSGDYRYKLLEDGAVMIYEYNGKEKELTVPAEIDGLPVTVIGARAFSRNGKIGTLTLPEGIRRIEESAFYSCSSLASVSLPSTLQYIGKDAFSLCRKLESIELPEGLLVLGDGSLGSMTRLKSVILPGTLTELQGNPFASSSKLEEFVLNDNPFLLYENGLLIDTRDMRIVSVSHELTEGDVVIPEGIRIIGESAFLGSDITTVTLPDTIEAIEDYAFASCNDLMAVTLSEGLRSIGRGAFYFCDEMIDMALPSTLRTLGDEAFIGCKSLIAITIPEGVTSIGAYAFSTCDALITVVLPESLTEIGDRAFHACKNLVGLVLPRGLTAIGSNPFLVCDSLSTFGLLVGHPTLAMMDDLLVFTPEMRVVHHLCRGEQPETIVVPEGVKSIGMEAFAIHREVKEFFLPETLERIEAGAFGNCDWTEVIHVPASVTYIADRAFYNCHDLTVKAPAGSYAEQYCVSEKVPFMAE